MMPRRDEEVARYSLLLKPNELGESFLVVVDFLSAQIDFEQHSFTLG